MITNYDIEIAFVRAQNRINERIESAQVEFVMPDFIRSIDALARYARSGEAPVQNENNPIANEEI